MQCIYRRQPIINRSCRYVFLFGLVLWNWWTSWTAMMMTQRNPLPGFSATGGGIPPSLLEHTVQVWRYDPGESKGVSTCFQPSITGKGFVTLFGHQPLTWFVITLTQFVFRTTVLADADNNRSMKLTLKSWIILKASPVHASSGWKRSINLKIAGDNM